MKFTLSEKAAWKHLVVGRPLTVAEIGMLNFNALDGLIEIGYQSAIRQVESWKTAIRES